MERGTDMHYDSVLTYVRTVLENSHIPAQVFEEPFEHLELIDLGLRTSLRRDFEKEDNFQEFLQTCEENTLYYMTDEFFCSYTAMRLPNPDTKQYLVIGPYTYVEIDKKNFFHIAEQLHVPAEALPLMENFYFNLAFISSETQFKNMIGTLADTIWQGNSNYRLRNCCGNLRRISATDTLSFPESEQLLLTPANIETLEYRYEYENQLMMAVSQGNRQQIDLLLSRENAIRPVPRLSNSLRDYKNYMIILNTLLRKAAEQSAVHPVYLDQLSTRFAKQIEELTSISGNRMEKEMLHKYCLLVQNYSVKGYSPIIQKVINQISINLSENLSLKSLSEFCNISAGYLSTLFKKEVGITLTDYINKKRVDHAILLLNATNLQIQTIAGYCGLNDLNYFTRIFKKFQGMTPKKYRELISRNI